MLAIAPPAVDPMLRGFANVRKLTGFSGADVFLVTRGHGVWFVRKAATLPVHNDRLRRQARKQEAFGDTFRPMVRTPPIFGEGVIDERYYFDMEFVRGQDGASFVRSAPCRQLTVFARRLRDYIEASAQAVALAAPAEIDFGAALRTKVDQIRHKLDGRHLDLIAWLDAVVHRAVAVNMLRATVCHGDLTLENMMIDERGTLWFFDLLDAPVEHYWFDLSKLHQDFQGGWYLRRGAPIAHSALSYVNRELRVLADRLDERYATLHDVLLAVTFARILPYAERSCDVQFIRARLAFFLRRAEKQFDDQDCGGGGKIP